MKKILILLFSILISFNSYGEWTEYNDEYTQTEEILTYYIDKDTITKQDGYVYWWMLIDNVEPFFFTDYMSLKVYSQGDCGLTRIKILSGTGYIQPMGEGIGETINYSSAEWESLPPDHLYILDYVCDYVD